MILDKVLILKGLAGVTTIGSAVTVGVVGHMNGWWGNHQLTPEEIKTGLGLPEGCNLGDTVNCNEVEVTTSNINKMKFDGLTTGQNPSISGTAKLTVTKVTPTDPNFPFDYKFSLQGKDSDATLTLGSKTITLKTNEATEFKIKGNSASNLSLEKAWTAKSLGVKVGLLCTESSNTDKSCTLKDGSINVKNGDNDKITNARVKNPSDKKIKYEEDQEGYNQKIRFYLEGSDDITLTNATNGAGSDVNSGEKKICKKGDTGSESYYEIKEESGTWYLTKKTNGSSG